jgi:hypothetical protein
MDKNKGLETLVWNMTERLRKSVQIFDEDKKPCLTNRDNKRKF